MSADMQQFLRDLRYVLRSSNMRDTACLNARLNDSAIGMVCAYESNGNHPRFLMDRMKRLMTVTLRAIETDAKSKLFRSLKRLVCLLKKSICLQQGRVCGKQSTAACPICLQENGCSWWTSNRCGHSFHVKCIAKCMDTNERCPLCRNDHWRNE